MMKFGIITEASRLQQWQCAIVDEVRQKYACLALIITTRRSHAAAQPQAGALYHVWHRYAAKHLHSCGADFIRRMQDSGCLLIDCSAEQASNGQFAATLARIRSLGIDFLLHFGDDSPAGGLLECARHGVWCFHYGDAGNAMTQPVGFREMCNEENQIAGTLLRLGSAGTTDTVLQRFAIARHKTSWSATVGALRDASIPMIGNAIADLANGVAPSPSAANVQRRQAAPARSLPGNADMLRFGFVIARALLKNLIRRAFFTHHWQIAACRDSLQEILGGGIRTVSMLDRGGPGSFFYADPFVLSQSSQSMSLLVERYDWKKRKGELKRLDVLQQGDRLQDIAEYPLLETDSHLSYPLVVRVQDKIFMLPESGKAGCIVLHEIDAAANIVNSTTIIDNTRLVDPTIVHHNGRYWLLASNGKGELFIWHSDVLHTGWRPHAKQPALISPSQSRGAGSIFMHDGQLIRPTQDCSTTYGRQILLNRITELNEYRFTQELVAVIPAVVGTAEYDGLHTFNAMRDGFLIDLRTLHFDLLKPFRIIARGIRQRLHAPAPRPPLALEPRAKPAAADD